MGLTRREGDAPKGAALQTAGLPSTTGSGVDDTSARRQAALSYVTGAFGLRARILALEPVSSSAAPRRWRLETEVGSIVVTSADLDIPTNFRRRLLEATNQRPRRLDPDTHDHCIDQLLRYAHEQVTP